MSMAPTVVAADARAGDWVEASDATFPAETTTCTPAFTASVTTASNRSLGGNLIEILMIEGRLVIFA